MSRALSFSRGKEVLQPCLLRYMWCSVSGRQRYKLSWLLLVTHSQLVHMRHKLSWLLPIYTLTARAFATHTFMASAHYTLTARAYRLQRTEYITSTLCPWTRCAITISFIHVRQEPGLSFLISTDSLFCLCHNCKVNLLAPQSYSWSACATTV